MLVCSNVEFGNPTHANRRDMDDGCINGRIVRRLVLPGVQPPQGAASQGRDNHDRRDETDQPMSTDELRRAARFASMGGSLPTRFVALAI